MTREERLRQWLKDGTPCCTKHAMQELGVLLDFYETSSSLIDEEIGLQVIDKERADNGRITDLAELCLKFDEVLR